MLAPAPAGPGGRRPRHAARIAHMAASPILVTREDRFALPPAELWELVGNTDHVNRLIGLPAVAFGPAQESPQGLFRPASARMLGLRLVWREYAFDWVRDQSHEVLRVYQRGPLERARLGLELTPEPAGCRLRQFAELTPRRRRPLAGLISRRIAARHMDALARYCAQQVRLRAMRSAAPFPRTPPHGVNTAVLGRLQARLLAGWPADAAVVERLVALLREGSDEEVLRMRPFALARRWGLAREAVLRTFLYATVAGLLELDWELMCPNCRVPKAGFGTLGEVTEQFHCDLCGTDYTADLDRSTELRFSVHPTVRTARDAIYCIGGPHNGLHILVQQGLPPGEGRSVAAALPAEPLRVRVLQRNCTALLRPAPDGPTALDLHLAAEGWRPEALAFRPGPVRLRWHNGDGMARVAVVEREQWDPDAATAARVMAFPEFRALFSSEVLQPGRQLGVRNLCVLFTDLKGSTALYEHVGDAPAYGQVHRHFDFLIACFRSHEGGIVKTIGDAVMASFPSPEAALRAALEVQQRVGDFNAQLGAPEPVVIKIGLHNGPAISINANGQMDYFGRTVNIAARIQGLSEGDDIVLAEALWAEPSIQAVLAGAPFTAERFLAHLKGIAGDQPMIRLRPLAAAPAAADGPPRLFRY
jgi:adenylate cyclase